VGECHEQIDREDIRPCNLELCDKVYENAELLRFFSPELGQDIGNHWFVGCFFRFSGVLNV